MTALESSRIELPQGTVSYREGGSGAPIVFVHGLLVDGRLWSDAAERLAESFRCIVPDWPMGSHTIPINEDADLSPPGMAALVAEFLDRLELDEVTIVGNDSGGAVSQMLVTTRPERIGRLVLTNCDTHDNFPPFPFNLMKPIARMPAGMPMLVAPFRLGPVRRTTYGLLAKHPIDRALVDSWLEPAMTDAAIRRDTHKFLTGADKSQTIAAAEKLERFERPALLAWAPEDRFFKLSYAERLAAAMPDARIEQIADAKTFVPLDQPERLADAITKFIAT